MKKIYRLFFLMLFMALMNLSFAQKREHRTPEKGHARQKSLSSSKSQSVKGHDVSAARTRQPEALTTAPNYYVSTADEPWSSNSNINAMNNAFGSGNWSRVTFDDPDVLTIFDAATDFIFLEGSDDNAEELDAFLIANITTIENWVNAGGRLLLNAAPNEGGDFSFGFGGTTLVYDNAQGEVNVIGPILSDPFPLANTVYYGGSFSHAHVTGNNLSPLILGADENVLVLAEKTHGDGLVGFGGMTQSSFHDPQPDADNLMANILYYFAKTSLVPAAPEAKFIASQTEIIVNRELSLVDISKNRPTTRTWTISPSTFEYIKGTNEHSSNPKLKFIQAGTYSITLTVSNTLGSDTETKTNYVTAILPKKFYWVGGGGEWFDYENHWATTSGGSTFYDREPGEDDLVFFDANSFSADDQVVDMDGNSTYAYDMSFSGVTHNPEISNGYLYLNGSLLVANPVQFTIDEIGFQSDDATTIDLTKAELSDETSIWVDGRGAFDFVSPIKAEQLSLYGGLITTNGHTITVENIYVENDDEELSIDFEGSEVHATRRAGIYIDDESPFKSDFKFFLGKEGEDSSIENNNDLELSDMTILGDVEFYNDLTIEKFTIVPGASADFDGNTITISTIELKGTATNNITITDGTLSKTSGTVVGTYLHLTDVEGMGGAAFYADKNSVDNGGNTGWIFSTKDLQDITFAALVDKIYSGTTFNLSATSTSGLAVSFSILSGPATLAGNTVTLTGTGKVVVMAYQEGNATYMPATDVRQSFMVTKASQTITFNVADKIVGDPAFNVTATGGASGKPVTFSILSGPATLSGSTITLTGTTGGPVVIRASQEGNDNYLPAFIDRTFCVSPVKLSVSVTGLETETPVLTASTANNYQWLNNGTAISGATSNTYTVTAPGSYTVTTQSATCVSAPSNAQILIITGVERSLDASVKVFPNPVVNELIIDIPMMNSRDEASVILYDISGKQMTNAKGKGRISIPMQSYNTGLYAVIVKVGAQRITKHVIKN